MADATRDLINQLATRAGMLMEDTSIQAITLGSVPNSQLEADLENIAGCVERMTKYVDAARALQE